MADKDEIAKLEAELKELKARRPEHCSGRDHYVGSHQSSIELLEKIEELEEKIKDLRAKTGGGPGRPSGRTPTRPG